MATSPIGNEFSGVASSVGVVIDCTANPLAGMPQSDGVPQSSTEPAVTRVEIANYFAELVAPQVTRMHSQLGRPGVLVLRCRFEGFYEDMRRSLEAVLSTIDDIEVIASWPSTPDDRKTLARETIDALNKGRPRLYVVPHERALIGSVPFVDGVLDLPRFSPQSLASACQRFYDLVQPPNVAQEPWVAQVSPHDLLINSAVSADPITHVRSAVLQRLSDHDCTAAIPLESLLGLSVVRDWAEALIEDIRDALDPQVRCHWSQIERAVVFSGSLGAGKASLSRAIARATGLNWYRVSTRRWVAALDSDGWVRGTDRRVVQMVMEEDFEAAQALAPAVLFIEDVDQLRDELALPLGQLIAQVDPNNPLFVIGATTDESLPESELLKSANFERTVYLPLPSSTLLAGALKQRLASANHALTEEEVMQVGRLALGGTVADIDRYLRRAEKTARRANNRQLNFDDLATAILETPTIGARPKISEDELAVTAYHEAGHAVIHFLDVGHGKEIQYATVVPRRIGGGTALGFVMRVSDEDSFSMSKTEALAKLRMMLGGRGAEEILLGVDRITTGSGGSDGSDLAKATKLAAYLIGRCGFNAKESLVYRDASLEDDPGLREEVELLLKEQYRQTRSSLQANWHLVQALAKRLVDDQELSGQEVRRVLTEASRI